MARTPPPAQSPPQPRRSAFTLIEMVVVIGIIGVLMAMGIPGIVSQIKKADLYNTTNIIAALHTYCINASRDQIGFTGTQFFLEITPTTAVVKAGSAIVPSSDIGKQFAFASPTDSTVSFEDMFAPSAAKTITYGIGTGFVAPTTVIINDKKPSPRAKFHIIFLETGVINVRSAP